ncbi:hydratase [Motilimonas pumila]|uniref:Hydratase n=1 Tax=Motilimonas pumila TaxID=2303987 RepID=A0A418YKM3_9GAMM|nr:hydratase [Motilimonas pumila]RJG51517.1 hydratase [Motilimonas pumila]
MDLNNIAQAAAELAQRRSLKTNVTTPLAPALTPLNLDHALAIQQATASLRNDDIAAWKCLQPLAQNKPIVAPIFADTLQQGEACQIILSSQGQAQIEPEIAFILDQDFAPRGTPYTEQEVCDAISHCHMALELMQFRFDETIDFYTKLADCLVNQGLYLGPVIDTKQALQASKIDIIYQQGSDSQCVSGQHPNALPQQPLFWLVNHLTARGITLRAGQAVITGSYAGIINVKPNLTTRIEYQGLGTIETCFVPLKN